MLADNGEAEQVEGFKNIYPIYWKTTDAGQTWVGPEVVQLDGPNGVAGIVNDHLTDQQIGNFLETILLQEKKYHIQQPMIVKLLLIGITVYILQL